MIFYNFNVTNCLHHSTEKVLSTSNKSKAVLALENKVPLSVVTNFPKTRFSSKCFKVTQTFPPLKTTFHPSKSLQVRPFIARKYFKNPRKPFALSLKGLDPLRKCIHSNWRRLNRPRYSKNLFPEATTDVYELPAYESDVINFARWRAYCTFEEVAFRGPPLSPASSPKNKRAKAAVCIVINV
ncbi:hypothetical protein TNIN_68001 [Trichonephila inaurata madagascariensis]|uniref:Uncharacterized protein n=1 Tax=Trichonephila inaurata madagascariensis TaxID=2747483 RepID=A0A8X6X1H2_9ARAC|nr:hypothetical protein TNIN_68001 [Trichonephila inaurata madagascariensis]